LINKLKLSAVDGLMYQMQEDESLFFEINGKEVDNAG
jgi:hypothetical protein